MIGILQLRFDRFPHDLARVDSTATAAADEAVVGRLQGHGIAGKQTSFASRADLFINPFFLSAEFRH